MRDTKSRNQLPVIENGNDVYSGKKDGEKEVCPEVVGQEGRRPRAQRCAEIARVQNSRENSVL